MEFNKEIFGTEEDYIFQLSNCIVLKILVANEPCSFFEIVLVAKYFLPADLFDLVKKEIEYSLLVARGLKEVQFNDKLYSITNLGVEEMISIMEDINEKHRDIINEIEPVIFDN